MMVIIFQTLLMVIGMLTGDDISTVLQSRYFRDSGRPVKTGFGERQPPCGGKNICILRALCDLFHVPARAVTPLLQYPQHWERTVHHRHDGALPDGNLFLRVGRLAFLHPFGSPTADDRFLLGGTDFPIGSLLSVELMPWYWRIIALTSSRPHPPLSPSSS